jgi:hypothetical protein
MQKVARAFAGKSMRHIDSIEPFAKLSTIRM